MSLFAVFVSHFLSKSNTSMEVILLSFLFPLATSSLYVHYYHYNYYYYHYHTTTQPSSLFHQTPVDFFRLLLSPLSQLASISSFFHYGHSHFAERFLSPSLSVFSLVCCSTTRLVSRIDLTLRRILFVSEIASVVRLRFLLPILAN